VSAAKMNNADSLYLQCSGHTFRENAPILWITLTESISFFFFILMSVRQVAKTVSLVHFCDALHFTKAQGCFFFFKCTPLKVDH